MATVIGLKGKPIKVGGLTWDKLTEKQRQTLLSKSSGSTTVPAKKSKKPKPEKLKKSTPKVIKASSPKSPRMESKTKKSPTKKRTGIYLVGPGNVDFDYFDTRDVFKNTLVFEDPRSVVDYIFSISGKNDKHVFADLDLYFRTIQNTIEASKDYEIGKSLDGRPVAFIRKIFIGKKKVPEVDSRYNIVELAYLEKALSKIKAKSKLVHVEKVTDSYFKITSRKPLTVDVYVEGGEAPYMIVEGDDIGIDNLVADILHRLKN